jgi:hypothetical protein
MRWVGGGGQAVDAVGVDLQQDGAVPSAVSDRGHGHPGVQPQRHRRVPRVVGRRPNATSCWHSRCINDQWNGAAERACPAAGASALARGL